MGADQEGGEWASNAPAIRWLGGIVAAMVVLYALVSALVTDDAYFTRLGRYKEVHFVLQDVAALQRDDADETPIIWIVGNSVTRDAFDAASVESHLQAAGSRFIVRKFAFNRGAPVFSQAIADDLPLRPGDRVVTSVSEGNFRRGWLEGEWLQDGANFDLYVESILSPAELYALSGVPWQMRAEWSLASAPPAEFFRNQNNYRRGLYRWTQYQLGIRTKPLQPRVVGPYQPFVQTDKVLRRSRLDWTVPKGGLLLGEGQSNWQGLNWLREDCEQRGANLTVLYVPAHPRFYTEFVDEETVEQVQEHFRSRTDLDYRQLRPRNAKSYFDHRHPNNRGRESFSRELASLLLSDEGLTLPPVVDPMLAAPGDVPSILQKNTED